MALLFSVSSPPLRRGESSCHLARSPLVSHLLQTHLRTKIAVIIIIVIVIAIVISISIILLPTVGPE